MRKNTLTTAVLAGLTGVAGIVSVSNAVHVNPDGTGQALIYPYYNTRAGNDTLISVVNTTSDVKAIKVRFIEGENSQEVLDFNLYMSPFDVWTATISKDDAGVSGFSTNDNSCLVPNITGNPFLTTLFAGDDRTGQDRTSEGYVEMLEMGVVEGPLGANAIHDGSGVPADCAALSNAWVGSGVWAVDPDDQMGPPSGGLFGSAVVINVPGSRAFGYDAVALENYFVPENPSPGTFIPRVSLHSNPGDLDPSLADAFPPVNYTVLGTGVNPVVIDDEWDSGVLAVSAALMTDQVMNQYAAEEAISGHTEWVVTFPTKRFHTNGANPIPPFNSTWDGNEACEEFVLDFWNREEQTSTPGGPPVSPPPQIPGLNLCWEVNVLTFNNSVASDGPDGPVLSDVLASNLFVDFDLRTSPGFETGWAQVGFNGTGPNGPIVHEMANNSSLSPNPSGRTYVGLPTAGFAVQTADSAALNALFGAGFDHAYSRVIQ